MGTSESTHSTETKASRARMQDLYQKNVVPALMKQFNYSSPMQVPRLKKVVINTGVGESVQNQKVMDFAVYTLTQISGQKPVVTRSKKAIANFKIREGLPIGCMVTLRNQRMFEFVDRLVSVALPRVRDFRGLPRKGFDGRGSYTMGLKESIVFPEVVVDKLDKIRGFDITFVTTAATDEEGFALLSQLGLPFRK
ncbi:MAG: 50S ribosomal protein L5 [Bdellovibrionota bacterium]|nr:MAG: 50S ribosomal protein L5 [Bdellovibrionota bacterium]